MNDKKRECKVLGKQNFKPKYWMVYDKVAHQQIDSANKKLPSTEEAA